MAQKRAVLYLRLSDSSDVSTSIVRQERDLRAYCDREGWVVVHEPFKDDGKSGGKRRAKADAAMDMMASGQADVVLCWKVDRMSRQGARLVVAVEKALEKNPDGLFVSVKDNLTTDNEMWRMQLSFTAEMARYELASIRKRIDSSMKYLRVVGRWAGGTVPYGYKSVKDPNSKGSILVIDPVEAEEVRNMAAKVLAYESLYSIMRDLNQRGVLTRSSTIVRDRLANELPPRRVKATKWSIPAIKLLLTSDVICGRVLHKDSKEVVKKGKENVVAKFLLDDKGMPKEQWPPVLDIETVSSLRTILNPEKPPGVVRRRKHDARLLSGLVRCAQCGKPLYAKPGVSGRPTVYECSSRTNGLECKGCSIQAAPLEAFVEAALLDKWLYSPVFEFVESTKNEIEAAEIERSINDTLLEMREFTADIVALSSRLQILKSREAEAAKEKPELLLRHTGEYYTPDYMAGLSTAEKRALLTPNIESLTIAKGLPGRHGLDESRINIEWRTLKTGPDTRSVETKARDAERVAAVKAALKKNYEER